MWTLRYAAALALLCIAGARVRCDDKLCSLNGECWDGQCHCDPAWTGDGCATLNVLPTPATSGYRNETHGSWCGSLFHAPDQEVVYPDGTRAGPYYMAVSEMSYHCGLNAWRSNSRIILTSASAPDGEFKFVKEIFPPFTHNPTVIRAPDGSFMLFHTGVPPELSPEVHMCVPPDEGVEAPHVLGPVDRDYFNFTADTSKLFSRYFFYNHTYISSGEDIEDTVADSEIEAMERCEELVHRGRMCMGFTTRPGQDFPTNVLYKAKMSLGQREDTPPPGFDWRSWLRVPAFSDNMNVREEFPNWDAVWRTIYVSTTKNLNEAWVRRPALKARLGRWDDSIENPGVVLLKNGTMLMVYRAGNMIGANFMSEVGLAASNSMLELFHRVRDDPIWEYENDTVDPYGYFSNEDPTIWQDHRGNFHVFTHHMHPPYDWPLTVFCGGHMFSEDGLTWHRSPVPAYTGEISFLQKDGSVAKMFVQRRERPQVYLDPESGHIKYLTTGIEPLIQPPFLHYTHTFVQRVNTEPHPQPFGPLTTKKFNYPAAYSAFRALEASLLARGRQGGGVKAKVKPRLAKEGVQVAEVKATEREVKEQPIERGIPSQYLRDAEANVNVQNVIIVFLILTVVIQCIRQNRKERPRLRHY